MFKVGYSKEIIDAEWVSEIIIERFDAAFELLSPSSVIYGGAVRDALAGMPLIGDLDISVPPKEFGAIQQSFDKSTRWKPVNRNAMLAKPAGKYGKRRMPIIGSIIEFEGVSGARAQLICSNDSESSPRESALHVPRNVDILCCGVVIDIDGRVYEVVKEAYDDCKKGILRLNKDMQNPHVESLKERSAKLEERGWTNQIDMKAAGRLERRKKPKSPRLKKSKSKSTVKKISTDNYYFKRGTAIHETWPDANDPVKHDHPKKEWREIGRWSDEPVEATTATAMPDPSGHSMGQPSRVFDDVISEAPDRPQEVAPDRPSKHRVHKGPSLDDMRRSYMDVKSKRR